MEALLPLTKLDRSELQGMTLEKLRVVWAGLRPSKKIQVLPTGWRKADKLTLLKMYQNHVVDFYNLAPDGHWLQWTRDRLVVELDQYQMEARGLLDEPEEEGKPLVPFCPECGLGMIERTNRMDGSRFFGCVRFPACRATLPMTVGGNPSPVVQKALKAKEKEQYLEWLANRKEKKNPENFEGYKVPVIDQDEEMKGPGPVRATRVRKPPTEVESEWSKVSSSSDLTPDAGQQGAGSQGQQVIRDPEAIKKKMVERQRDLKRAKQGLCKRFLGDCRRAAMAAIMLTAVTLGSVGSGLINATIAGSDRPDLLEIFGGNAEVSCSFSRWGWWSLEPVDICYGVDLRNEKEREELLRRIEHFKPRLVVVSYPCTVYSPLTNLSYRTSQAKHKLQQLRKRERPFLEFCRDVFKQQKERGDDALGENPLHSASFSEGSVREVLEDPEVFVGIGHGCMYGIRNIKTGHLLRKPTLWFSTSPEICQELSKTCDGKHEHGQCMGGKTVTEHAGRYTVDIAKAIQRGFIRTLRRKEPSRIQTMLKSVQKRLVRNGPKDKTLTWTPKQVGRALAQWVGAVDQPAEPGDEVMEQEEKHEEVLGSLGIVFRVPKNRWLPPVIKSTLKKLHANLGHPGKDDMKRFLRNAGVENEMIEAVDWMECGACAQSQRPRVHRASKLPPSDARFNDRVMVDCCQIKDVRGKGFWFLCILDAATMYHTIGLIHDHSPKSLLEGFRNNWMNAFGPPEELSIDQERGFIGPQFSETLQEMCVKVTSIAGQAHWQHGKVERHIGILKDMMSRVVKHTQASGPEQLELVCKECTRAKNSLILT